MSLPMPGLYGRLLPWLPQAAGWASAGNPWHLVSVAAESDPSVGEYGLLDPRLADEPELPREGLLSAMNVPVSVEPGAVAPANTATREDADASWRPAANDGALAGLMERFGFAEPAASSSSTDLYGTQSVERSGPHRPLPQLSTVGAPRSAGDLRPGGPLGGLADAARFVSGLGSRRDDLVWDEYGNLLAPEVKNLVDDIRMATKADEPALRRRIIEMFPGEPRTSNWFHSHLSDVLAGDPPEDVHDALSYFADERLRENRRAAAFWAGAAMAVPAARKLPTVSPDLPGTGIFPGGTRSTAPGQGAGDTAYVRTINAGAAGDPMVVAREHYDMTRELVRQQRNALNAEGPGALQRGGVQLNRQQGTAMEGWSLIVEREFSGYLVDPGGRLNLPHGRRTFDHTYSQPAGGAIVGYGEVKSGNAKRTSQQRLNDEHLESQGYFVKLLTERYLRERSR